MKIYIAGPMSGYPDFNYPAFNDAETLLELRGHEPLNPARNGDSAPATADWAWFMRASIGMLIQADGIALLPDWHRSRGAVIEQKLAVHLGMPDRTLSSWLQQWNTEFGS